MSTKHSKKRNVGLLYEFLIRMMSSALVDGDDKKSASALRILKKHFREGTELHREFRLINSLVRTTVSKESVAASILTEAKRAAKQRDLTTLEKQKTHLIHDINRAFLDEGFYDQHINEYKAYATVQTLLNDWRNTSYEDITRVAMYEDTLVQWLLTERVGPKEDFLIDESNGTTRALMNVMMKKLNEKYKDSLDPLQKSIIRAYALSSVRDDKNIVSNKLTNVKSSLLEAIDSHLVSDTNEYVGKKLVEAKEMLLTEDTDTVDDASVTRFMLYAKLIRELRAEEDNAK